MKKEGNMKCEHFKFLMSGDHGERFWAVLKIHAMLHTHTQNEKGNTSVQHLKVHCDFDAHVCIYFRVEKKKKNTVQKCTLQIVKEYLNF